MKVLWMQAVLGCWVLISPWLFGVGTNAVLLWSNVIAGVAIVLLALWSFFEHGKH